MKIEWASNFAPDGTRRTPPASTIHGWLAKWRGTLKGDEHLRNRGMAEMRKAASYRRAHKRYQQKKAERRGASGSGLLSFFHGSKAAPQSRRLASRRSARPPKSPQSSTGRRLTSRSTSSSNTDRQRRPPSRTHPKTKPQGAGSRRAHGRT